MINKSSTIIEVLGSRSKSDDGRRGISAKDPKDGMYTWYGPTAVVFQLFDLRKRNPVKFSFKQTVYSATSVGSIMQYAFVRVV